MTDYALPITGTGSSQAVSAEDHDDAINAELTSLSNDITTEAAARASGDTALAADIVAEAAARDAAISAAIGALGDLAQKDTVDTADIATSAVTNDKMADMSEARFKGRKAGAGAGQPQDMTAAEAREAMGLGTAATTDATDYASAAAINQEADTRDAADVVEVWRPGENASVWSQTTTGAPEDRAPVAVGSVTSNADGAVLRITGSDIDGGVGYGDFAPRAAYAMELDRVYLARAVVRRAVDPVDPLGHAVELRARNLSASKASVSTVALADAIALTVADGRVEIAVYVCRGTPPAGVTAYSPPTTARYMTPFVRIYGNGAETDIEALEWSDVTESLTVSSDIDAVADALATHAGLTDNPHAVTKAQVGLGSADNTSDADKPISTATQAALNLKADEADLAVEVATRESLIVSKDGGGVVITDPAGFVLARINADGSIKTVMHDIGVGADGGLIVRDPAGFVLFRVGRDGALSLGGNAYMRGDFGDGLVVTDPAGFVLLRADSSGMRVLGEAVGGDAGEQARTGVLRRGLTGMHRWRQARGNVVQAYGEARILCIGDSNTAGGTVDVGVSRRANAYPTALATLLDRHYGATSAGFYGSAGQGAAYPTYDPRVALGSGWSPVGAAVSLGGEVFANTTTTAALTFAPGIEWDTAEIIVAGIAAGDLTADVGGAASPYSATVGAVTTLTFDAGSVGEHTLSISRVSGEVHVVGVICRNSTAPAITVVNGGRGGWKTSDIVDDAEFYSPLNVLPTVDADLVLIEIGINDHTAGVTPATYAANLQTIIDACPSGADVALVSSVTPTSAGKSYFWADYQAAMYAVAAANDLPVIDMTVAMGDRPVIEAQGWNVDNVHPTRAGLAEKANAILKLLIA